MNSYNSTALRHTSPRTARRYDLLSALALTAAALSSSTALAAVGESQPFEPEFEERDITLASMNITDELPLLDLDAELELRLVGQFTALLRGDAVFQDGHVAFLGGEEASDFEFRMWLDASSSKDEAVEEETPKGARLTTTGGAYLLPGHPAAPAQLGFGEEIEDGFAEQYEYEYEYAAHVDGFTVEFHGETIELAFEPDGEPIEVVAEHEALACAEALAGGEHDEIWATQTGQVEISGSLRYTALLEGEIVGEELVVPFHETISVRSTAERLVIPASATPGGDSGDSGGSGDSGDSGGSSGDSGGDSSGDGDSGGASASDSASAGDDGGDSGFDTDTDGSLGLDDDGCGCSADPSRSRGASLLLLLPGLLLLRRRRARASA